MVPVCNKTTYLGNCLSTLSENDMTNEGIKQFNVNFNIFMSEFKTCRDLVKNKFLISIVVFIMDHSYGHYIIIALMMYVLSGEKL